LFFNLLDGLAYDPEPLGAEAIQIKEDQSSGFGLFSSSIEFEILPRKKMYRDVP
jgi:hypothetical protein